MPTDRERAEPNDLLEGVFHLHRRVERRLAQLATLCANLEAWGPGAENAASALALLDCFDRECVLRHGEEERELWPQLERRLRGDLDRSEFRALRRALAAQHQALARAWARARRPLPAVAEGLPRRLDGEAIARFRALWAHHIHEEEAMLHRVSARLRPPRRRHRPVMELPSG